jgi:hypothetical protein
MTEGNHGKLIAGRHRTYGFQAVARLRSRGPRLCISARLERRDHPALETIGAIDMSKMSKAKVVAVRAYRRWRYGRFEHVCAHWRSNPDQLSFTF